MLEKYTLFFFMFLSWLLICHAQIHFFTKEPFCKVKTTSRSEEDLAIIYQVMQTSWQCSDLYFQCLEKNSAF